MSVDDGPRFSVVTCDDTIRSTPMFEFEEEEEEGRREREGKRSDRKIESAREGERE